MRFVLMVFVIGMGATAGALECRTEKHAFTILPKGNGHFQVSASLLDFQNEYTFDRLKQKYPRLSDDMLRKMSDVARTQRPFDQNFGRCTEMANCDFTRGASLAACSGNSDGAQTSLSVVPMGQELKVVCAESASSRSSENGLRVNRSESKLTTIVLAIPAATCQ